MLLGLPRELVHALAKKKSVQGQTLHFDCKLHHEKIRTFLTTNNWGEFPEGFSSLIGVLGTKGTTS